MIFILFLITFAKCEINTQYVFPLSSARTGMAITNYLGIDGFSYVYFGGGQTSNGAYTSIVDIIYLSK